jgi:predicted DNA-binding transcriptional regulator YafY
LANGKNPYLRYRIINACFINRQKPYHTITELIETMDKNDIVVSQRSIESDLQAMRYDERLAYHAPIEYCRRNHGYYYTDAGYSIDKLPLSEDDIEAFDMIVESFQRFKGAQVLSQVEGLFDKLGKVAGQLKAKKSKLAYTPVLFERMPYYKGIEHFDVLHQAILRQTPLRIRYKRFEHEQAKEHILHPYLLKEYKFRWYLLCYSETRRRKLILALDRMEHIASLRVAFKPYKGAEVQKYFDHTIGVTITPHHVTDIRLWCSPSQGNYIKTQHLHTTQRIISDTADGLVISLQLIPNYELLQLLLAFGPEVKVLEPLSLRDEIKTMLEKSLELYR